MKIERICPNCGKKFECQSKGGGFKTYCCKECYIEHKGIGKKKFAECCVCGKQFELVHGKGKMVCSNECLGLLRKRILSTKEEDKPVSTCLNCGKTFRYEKYKSLRLELIPKFCNQECYFEYLKTNSKNVFDKTPQKEKAREIVKCEMCGKEFEKYKKTEKRFCSDECRKKYMATDEYKNKRKSTMLAKYGKLSVGNGVSEQKIEEYRIAREAKYRDLCEKSDLDLIEFIEKHVLLVKCRKCGKTFVTNNLSYLSYDHIPCKNCSDEYKDYNPSIKIYELLDSLGVKYSKNVRDIIKPYEIDIYLYDFNLGIEVNGNFWHSELCGKDKEYHIRKTRLCAEKGIKLIHIFEDEIAKKFDIVASRLKNLVHMTENKIYARKCIIREIQYSEKHEFLNKNHIQGDTNSKINVGLFFEDTLVSVMTFSKERIIYKKSDGEENYELIRFANILNTNVIGSFSKLLKYFIEKYKPKKITTYADSRWSSVIPNGSVYDVNGFKYDGQTKPNYWYMHKTDMLERKHRFTYTKQRILEKHNELDSSKTEWELMQSLGYNRIWDCGNMKFVMSF